MNNDSIRAWSLLMTLVSIIFAFIAIWTESEKALKSSALALALGALLYVVTKARSRR